MRDAKSSFNAGRAMTFLKKILLVDHEPKVTALVRRALESTGRYLVRIEPDSRLALHSVPWFRPDLILVDNGEAENADELLKSDPSLKSTPFLFVRSDKEAEKKVVTAGVINGYSFLATATSLEDLVRSIDELFSTR